MVLTARGVMKDLIEKQLTVVTVLGRSVLFILGVSLKLCLIHAEQRQSLTKTTYCRNSKVLTNRVSL
jgi:hypothetical protein